MVEYQSYLNPQTLANVEGLGLQARLIKHVPVDEREAEQSGKLPKIFKSANAS